MIHAFFSDPHFGHANIIKHAERPFAPRDLDAMHETLIANYNAIVGVTDTCLWVGDCFFGNEEFMRSILDQLNGSKLLVLGNHDRQPNKLMRAGFDLVMDGCRMVIARRRVRVCHYPYWPEDASDQVKRQLRYPERRPRKVKGEVLIHGHTHSKRKRDGNQIHVGCDAWDMGPAPYAEVEALVREVFGER